MQKCEQFPFREGEGIEVKRVRLRRGGFSLCLPLLRVAPGQKVAVMGENGSGKTTLLAALAGLVSVEGEVLVGDRSLMSLSVEERARLVAFLPQEASVVFPFTVHELVLMGRYPHRDGGGFGADDHRATDEVIATLGLQALSQRRYTNLSGGEQRRVMLARVLNQRAPVLLLDEPVAMLDVRHGLLFLSLLSRLGATVMAVMHEVNLALSFFDRFLFLKDGRIVHDVEKEAVSHEILSEVYGVSARRCWAFGFALRDEGCSV